jgi:hypothetical protein
MFAHQRVKSRSDENMTEAKTRPWLLRCQRLPTREQERRLEHGRLSMTLSMSSWGNGSMVLGRVVVQREWRYISKGSHRSSFKRIKFFRHPAIQEAGGPIVSILSVCNLDWNVNEKVRLVIHTLPSAPAGFWNVSSRVVGSWGGVRLSRQLQSWRCDGLSQLETTNLQPGPRGEVKP